MQTLLLSFFSLRHSISVTISGILCQQRDQGSPRLWLQWPTNVFVCLLSSVSKFALVYNCLHWETDFFNVSNGRVTEIFFPLSMSNDQLLTLGPWRNSYISVLQLIPLYWEQIVPCWTPLVFALAEINSRASGRWQAHRNTWVWAALPRNFLTSIFIRGVP